MTIPATDFNQTRLAFARASRALMGAVAAASLLALGACGGGEQAEKFQPSTMVAFGDENSAFAPLELSTTGSIPGGKYGVNSLTIAKGYGWPLTKEVGGEIQPNITVTGLPTGASMDWTNATDYPVSDDLETPILRLTPVTGGVPGVPVGVERQFNIEVPYADGATSGALASARTQFQYVYQCDENRLWIQILAAPYGLDFTTQCPVQKRGGAFSYAVAGAKVADIQAQVVEAARLGQLHANTLVTVLAGQNDVIAAYKSALDAGSVTNHEADMKARGQALAAIINNISATTGARVVYVTLPALQYSPRVRADTADVTKPHRAQAFTYMATLVEAFNLGLKGKGGVINDGRKFAIVDVYNEMAGNGSSTGMAVVPGDYGLSDASTAWCRKARRPDGPVVSSPVNSLESLLYCNSLTGYETGATPALTDPYKYLWADDTHVGPAAHAAFGGLAYNRVTANPL